MNAAMRRLIIEREGRECLFCKGTCHLQKEKCNVPAKTLPAATYWKLDSLRSPLGRLQVDHVYGKKREGWNEVATLCPCCHSKKQQGGGAIFEDEVNYLAFVSDEPEEYRVAREQEASEKLVRKAKRKAKSKAARKAQKAKLEKAKAKKPSRFGKKKEAQKARAALAFPMKYSSPSRKAQEQNARRNWNVY